MVQIQSVCYSDIAGYTGNSDPGTSGVLSPFGNIQGLSFNDSKEPSSKEFELKKDIEKILSTKGVECIQITTETEDDYYRLLDELAEFNKDSIICSGTSRNPLSVIIEDTRNQSDEDGTQDDKDIATEVDSSDYEVDE